MGKLLKYEFIKSRVPLIIFTILIVISELVFALGMIKENENYLIASIVLFSVMAPVCTLGGLILGAGAYTKELSNKVGFMVYMTPNSSYKIVGSKFVFTAIVEILFSAIFGILAFTDVTIIMNKVGIDEDMLDLVFEIADSFGLSLPKLFVAIAATFITVLLSMVMIVAVYYIAYTLTATFMQASKARTFVAAVIFILGAYGVTKLNSLLPTISYSTVSGLVDWTGILPQTLYSLLIIAISYFACSYMLDKKVSL